MSKKKEITDNTSPNPPRGRRPLQRVLDFLEKQIGQHGGTPQRLPTIRSIADELDVSPRTVQKAFHQMAETGRIKSVVGRGTFTVPEVSAGNGNAGSLRIGLNIELDRFDPVNAWAYTIYGAILQASLASGRNAVFCTVEEGLRNPDSRVDGFILLPDATELRPRLKQQRPRAPAVFLNPPALTRTSDFVSPDYNRIGRMLGKTWRSCGKKRIVFMHHPALAVSASGQLILSGLFAGLAETHGSLEYLHLVEAENFTIDAGHDAMHAFLRGKRRPPDAVFCKGDFLALGALRALAEAGCSIPGDVSVIGGSGLDLSETESPQLTRCRQPFQQLGGELFDMLVTRIEQNGAHLPGRYLPVPFIGGATTTAEENERLFAGREAAV